MDEKLFKKPPKEYTIAPFWFWNDELDIEHLKWQMREMVEKGVYETIISSRLGIQIPYLSEEWFERIEVIVGYAKELGMSIWIYDEDNWPSGYAGGKVLEENFDFCGKHVKRLNVLADISDWKEKIELPIVAVFDEEENNITQKECLADGKTKTVFAQDYTYWNPAYSNGYFPDVLNKKATQCFIKYTHLEYKKRMSKYFGNTIKGFFVDEPGFYNNLHLREINDEGTIPWTDEFPQYFQKKCGYDICDHLPCLWEEGQGDYKKVRIDFYETLCQMYMENYLEVLKQFCEENNMELIGHLHYEEFMSYHIATQGNFMKALEGLSFAGTDRIDTNEDKIAEKYASSAAHLCGHRRVLSETYALSGWELTLQDMKRWLDYQYVRGINMLVPHAFYSSIEGERSEECPPSEFYQNPYWKYFGQFSNYAKRASYVLSQGQPECNVAVYYPIHNMQAVYTPQSQRDVNERDKEFQKFTIGLMENQIDFDFLPKEYLLSGKVTQKGKLQAGKCNFSTIIFAQMDYYEKAEIDKIQELLQEGVNIIFADKIPEELKQYKHFENLYLVPDEENYKSYTYTKNIMPIKWFLMKQQQINIYLPEKQPQVKYMKRRIHDEDIYFIVNEGNKKISTELWFLGNYQVTQYDLETGESSEIPCSYQEFPNFYLGATHNGGEWAADTFITATQVTIDFEACGSRLFALSEGKKEIPKKRATELRIPLGECWNIKVDGKECKKPEPYLNQKDEIYFSGTFEAATEYCLPDDISYDKIYLEADQVYDCMEVLVNGTVCGSRAYEPYRIDITEQIKRGENEIQLRITNSLLNKLRHLPRRSGIYGGVSLVAIK